MANNNDKNQGQMQVNVPTDVEKGVYTNLAIMGFTPTAFPPSATPTGSWW